MVDDIGLLWRWISQDESDYLQLSYFKDRVDLWRKKLWPFVDFVQPDQSRLGLFTRREYELHIATHAAVNQKIGSSYKTRVVLWIRPDCSILREQQWTIRDADLHRARCASSLARESVTKLDHLQALQAREQRHDIASLQRFKVVHL